MVPLHAARAGLLAGLSVARLLVGADASSGRFAPSYASSTVVHAASQITGAFAPNTIVTLYGKELAYVMRAAGAADVRAGALPTVLPGTGVQVHLDGIPAPLYFVSPVQVNLLIPAHYRAGPHKLQLVRDGIAGPAVDVQVAAASPGLFQWQPGWALAVRLDGSLVTAANPARPGGVVILFSTGLGEVLGTRPGPGEIARGAASIAAIAQLAVTIGGVAIDHGDLFYAGLAPGFAGLYQINLRLPGTLAMADPEIRISVGGVESPVGVKLAVAAAER